MRSILSLCSMIRTGTLSNLRSVGVAAALTLEYAVAIVYPTSNESVNHGFG